MFLYIRNTLLTQQGQTILTYLRSDGIFTEVGFEPEDPETIVTSFEPSYFKFQKRLFYDPAFVRIKSYPDSFTTTSLVSFFVGLGFVRGQTSDNARVFGDLVELWGIFYSQVPTGDRLTQEEITRFNRHAGLSAVPLEFDSNGQLLYVGS